MNTVTMPKLSPTMTEGVIREWLFNIGDKIESGDALAVIETDKAEMELEVIEDGYVQKLLYSSGDAVSVGDPIAIITESMNDPIPEVADELEDSPISDQIEEVKEEVDTPVKKIPETDASNVTQPVGTNNSRQKISPLARRLAKEKNIDVSSLSGSGPGGRIIAKDIESCNIGKPLSRIRKVIAERLLYSKQQIPHFYASLDIEITPLLNLKKELKKQGYTFTINDFIIKACSKALEEFPMFCGTFDPKTASFKPCETFDICIAVSHDAAVFTPAITNTHERSLHQISQEVRSLVNKLKRNELHPNEMFGGFTISNMGKTGLRSFSAIINPPQVAILAVGGIQRNYTWTCEDPFIKQQMLSITVSCDHRVIDGMDAAEFLNAIKRYLHGAAALLI